MEYTRSEIADAVQAATREMGYQELRGKQEKVLQEYVYGRDTFVSLPTGSGSPCAIVLFLWCSTSCERLRIALQL